MADPFPQGLLSQASLLIDQLDGFVECVHSHYVEHWSEYLGLVAIHLRSAVIQNSRAYEVSLLQASRQFGLASIKHHLCAFLFSSVKDFNHTVFKACVIERGDISGGIPARSYLKLLCLFNYIINPVLGFTDQHGDCDGHTSLTRRAKGRANDRIDSVLLVCVWHYHHMVLSA